MTTAVWATVLDQSTDAGFRTWGQELGVTGLAPVGLIQTADTGQINWSTVTRAAANTAAGYEIWKFSDSSLFMKIEYGSAAVNTIPQMWITVGTGSNGSGTLTGQTSTRGTFTSGVVPSSLVTAYTSNLCHVSGAFSMSWKLLENGGNFPGAYLVIGKTCDGTGATTTEGFGVLRLQNGNQPATLQSVRIASTAQTFIDTPICAVVPGAVTSSLVGSNFQTYYAWLNVPEALPFKWASVVIVAEIPRQTTFSVALISSTVHTYLSVGLLNSGTGVAAYTGVYSYSMIYE